MAGSTTTTRTTSGSRALSADLSVAPFQFEDLVQAYYDCRRNKRNSASARQFEKDMEINLLELYDDLIAGTYRPGRSICFVVTRPKAREVWAAAFRDRVVHHLMYNHVAPRFYASFIADSCACIPGRGTLYAATRLESKIRSASENWSTPIFYLKCDLANFFVAIDKAVLRKQLEARITEPWWLALASQILMHDPREDYETRSPAHLFNRVPQHKRLVAVCITGDITHTLKAEGFDGSEDGTGRGQPIVACREVAQTLTCNYGKQVDNTDSSLGPNVVSFTSAVRRLTPRECERLQGMADDYTMVPWRGKPASECPDGPRYKAIGNSKAVTVVRWIGRRLLHQITPSPYG